MAPISSILLTVALAVAGASAVTTQTCLSGTKDRPSQTYDVAKYYCFQNEGSGNPNRDLLCPKGAAGYTTYACGGSCYSPNDYVCVDNQLKQPSQVPAGQTATCAGSPSPKYDPKRYHCYPGGVLCPFNTERCAGACYDPHVYSCKNGGLTKPPEDS